MVNHEQADSPAVVFIGWFVRLNKAKTGRPVIIERLARVNFRGSPTNNQSTSHSVSIGTDWFPPVDSIGESGLSKVNRPRHRPAEALTGAEAIA